MKKLWVLFAAVGVVAIICYNTKMTNRASQVQLTSTNLPALVGDGYFWVEARDGSPSKRGIVISNAVVIYRIEELKSLAPCFHFAAEEPLLNEILMQGAEQIKKGAAGPNIPFFFMSYERIHVSALSSNLLLEPKEVIKVQNVKLIHD